MHGSIGPSCAVALWEDDSVTVWTHSQGVYPLRKALAELLGLPLDRVRCVHVEGSGCYGHNGADDVAADAALAARAVPGQPVRLQWMREQEHGWEPLGSAMVSRCGGARRRRPHRRLAARCLEQHPQHAPDDAGGLLAGAEVEPPFTPPSRGRSRCRRAAARATATRSMPAQCARHLHFVDRCRCASRLCAGWARR